MAADRFHLTATRAEIDSSGALTEGSHETEGALTDGLATWFTIEGAPVAMVGSSGPNRSADHQSAKVGKVLVPLDATVQVLDGSDLLTVDERQVAHPDSKCRVPDIKRPQQTGVLEATCEFFEIDGHRVVRGQA